MLFHIILVTVSWNKQVFDESIKVFDEMSLTVVLSCKLQTSVPIYALFPLPYHLLDSKAGFWHYWSLHFIFTIIFWRLWKNYIFSFAYLFLALACLLGPCINDLKTHFNEDDHTSLGNYRIVTTDQDTLLALKITHNTLFKQFLGQKLEHK